MPHLKPPIPSAPAGVEIPTLPGGPSPAPSMSIPAGSSARLLLWRGLTWGVGAALGRHSPSCQSCRRASCLGSSPNPDAPGSLRGWGGHPGSAAAGQERRGLSGRAHRPSSVLYRAKATCPTCATSQGGPRARQAAPPVTPHQGLLLTKNVLWGPQETSCLQSPVLTCPSRRTSPPPGRLRGPAVFSWHPAPAPSSTGGPKPGPSSPGAAKRPRQRRSSEQRH